MCSQSQAVIQMPSTPIKVPELCQNGAAGVGYQPQLLRCKLDLVAEVENRLKQHGEGRLSNKEQAVLVQRFPQNRSLQDSSIRDRKDWQLSVVWLLRVHNGSANMSTIHNGAKGQQRQERLG